MKRKPIASITACVFALIVLLFQFLRVSVIGGNLMAVWQLPMLDNETSNLLAIIESAIALLIPITLVIFCILLVIEECRKEPYPARINRYLKLMVIPLALMVIGALEKTGYIFLYEGNFSLEYTWIELLTSALILIIYGLTVFDKLKSGYWLMLICFVFIIMEVCRLSFPNISYAYVIGNNVYLSTFAGAALFYFSYLFLGLSFVLYRRNT